MTARLPDFRLPCPVLPTRKEWIELGDQTQRYGMEHVAIRTDGRFYGNMHLRMKCGLPRKGQNVESCDEQRPERFAEIATDVLHPYLVELARGRYVIHGGNEESRVVLNLKSAHPDKSPVRCFILKYEDNREENWTFMRKRIPINLMEQGMSLMGKFEHDPKENLMLQAMGDGDLYEELFIGAKPDIVDIDVEKKLAYVNGDRPALLIILQGNFHERFARVEKAWHDSVVVPVMQGNANIREWQVYPRREDAPSVDVTGLAPKQVVDKFRGKLTGLLLRKTGLGALTASLTDKPAAESPDDTSRFSAPPEETGTLPPPDVGDVESSAP